MQNPRTATTAAFDGLVQEVCVELGISDKRLYEILGPDNYYDKLWRILTALGRVAPDRIEIMRADFNARCDRLTSGRTTPVTAAEEHRELNDVVHARLSEMTPDEQLRQIDEAIETLGRRRNELCERVSRRRHVSSVVVEKFGGRAS